MIKIFISNTPIYLLEKANEASISMENPLTVNGVIAEEFTSKKALLALIDKLEHSLKVKAVKIYHTDTEDLFEIFKSFYKPVFAAGGVVKNSKDEVLMIFRKGKWDLPKGKIEKKESKESAAVREVTEETGMKKLKLKEQILIYPWKQPCTYHTYWEDGKRILKHIYWYNMKSTDQSVFEPQFEEGITKVEWVSVPELSKLMKRSYGSIADVLETIVK